MNHHIISYSQYFELQDAGDLENRYPDVLNRLNSKYNSTADAKGRVESLRDRANALATETTQKYRKLQSMESLFISNAFFSNDCFRIFVWSQSFI